MGNFAALAQLGMLGTLTGALVIGAWLTWRKVKPAQDEPVTLSSQAGHIFEQYADLTARVAALEAEQKQTTRRMNDLDDSVEHRFRRLNARAKREEPAAEPEANAQPSFAFPAPMGANNRPSNGAMRPFGPFGGVGR